MLKLVPVRDSAPAPTRELHISRQSRDYYQFDESLFTLTGSVIFANFHSARIFAQRMNEKRDLARAPEKSVRASEINALGLIDEILHHIIAEYRRRRQSDAIERALDHLEETLDEEDVEETLKAFIETFPPLAVYKGEISAEAYLEQKTGDMSNREVALEELLLLWLTNRNPAAETFRELFDDEPLEEETAYPEVIDELRSFFKRQPTFGPDDQDLVDLLESPFRNAPHSLREQLEYIRTHWSSLLGSYMYRLLSSVDFLDEEDRGFFGPGPGPVEVYEFGGMGGEPENFSPDLDWMPSVVMIAKNVYVWLHQLSEHYGRSITTLDEVPDEELDRLQRAGFTALWLIGLWERSQASKRIKQMMGNPEAVASAYSIKRYEIAQDLGGEAAYGDLRTRARRRGIRMASDMVPNHMGIDSDWMIHHPDWFLGLDYSPFPTYSFNGPDLCDDERVGVYIEDHYYERSDAAVVFKRRDHWTGDEKFIYHGNDGTMMPWNDTAQLNYLLPEVREAVIQQILDVARRSSVIRFDAAMTLSKRHYQRLWFPEPGSGGDIPSRAQFGMTKAEFDEAMPKEFWREVVDRVAEEAPDTLLLAEAFWLMEGFFVRTLGMHRVYNSAFMNMMRDEKNDEYRQVMKNTLEFDPEILRRFVNFMNNPDEETAVEQFGKGDKYFGICTLMVTMPGLPMFGHGQIEGYGEKYGMEYRQSYLDEKPDPQLVERHERQIFPLLHERVLFAGVENFVLYDFFAPDGSVDENVFAYSNRVGDRRALILYHNRYADTRGWVRTSVAYAVKDDSGEKRLVQRSLSEGLGFPGGADHYVIFRDMVDDLEYIRNAQVLNEQGLYAELQAYQVHVFTDFRVVQDAGWQRYGELHDRLEGQGVPDMDEALRSLYLEPLHTPYTTLIEPSALDELADHVVESPEEDVDPDLLARFGARMAALLDAIQETLPDVAAQAQGDEDAVMDAVVERLESVLRFPARLAALRDRTDDPELLSAVDDLMDGWDPQDRAFWGAVIGWAFTHDLGRLMDPEQGASISRSSFEEWLLGKRLERQLQEAGVEEAEAHRSQLALRVMLGAEQWGPLDLWIAEKPASVLRKALRDEDVQTYLHVNRYQDILWFHKESFESLLWWRLWLGALTLMVDRSEDWPEALAALYTTVEVLRDAETRSDYRIDRLMDAVADKPTEKPAAVEDVSGEDNA